ncbi:MAG: hypothetical protein AB8B88_00940 [Devosiaceae bacterium]
MKTIIEKCRAGLLALLFVGAAAMAVPFLAGGEAQAQQARIGVAAAVRGDVSVISGASVRRPSGGEAMRLGDRVQTQVQSGMQVLLLDESVFTVGESNDLVIDRFIYDPDRSVGEIAARTTQGVLRFVSGGVSAISPNGVTIQTPSATIGTRGTSIDVIVGAQAVALAQAAGLIPPGASVDPATAVFVVLRGPDTNYAGISQRGRVVVQTAGGTVEVRSPGFGVFIPSTGAGPIGPSVVPITVNTAVTNAIELPGVGITTTLEGVDFTELPDSDQVVTQQNVGSPEASDPLPDLPAIESVVPQFDPGPLMGTTVMPPMASDFTTQASCEAAGFSWDAAYLTTAPLFCQEITF